MTPPRAVLVDMGGVLLDMQGSRGIPSGAADWRGREALLAHLRARGAHLGRADLERRLFGPWRRGYEERHRRGREEPWKPHLTRLRRGTGVRSRDLTLLSTWFRPYADRLRPLPGSRSALAGLARRRLALALVSNVPLPGALYRRVLERFGLAAPFGALRFSYDEGSRKPSPSMLRSALAELGERPEAALMVGDRRSADVAAGLAAGTRTVWVASEHDDGPEAEFTIGSIAELPELIDRLAAGGG
ncbi:MAG: HAD family hydrolase [Thermoanaerobaculia bacterium]|nr:HAD family hydrolase [Thermoanaerobaculia bacterium]